LREAWAAQAERLREMDRLLARPEYAGAEKEDGPGATPRLRQTLAARQQNLQLLRQLRQQIEADLLASLVGVRELVSRIHLARFTDAPASQAERLLAEIAGAVDSLITPPAIQEQNISIRKAE
jgi:hypothetical protein